MTDRTTKRQTKQTARERFAAGEPMTEELMDALAEEQEAERVANDQKRQERLYRQARRDYDRP